MTAHFEETLQKYKDTFHLSDTDLANKFSVSRPTIERWLRGKNLPHIIVENCLISIMRYELNKEEK